MNENSKIIDYFERLLSLLENCFEFYENNILTALDEEWYYRALEKRKARNSDDPPLS